MGLLKPEPTLFNMSRTPGLVSDRPEMGFRGVSAGWMR